jgi:hypothetical protein
MLAHHQATTYPPSHEGGFVLVGLLAVTQYP